MLKRFAALALALSLAACEGDGILTPVETSTRQPGGDPAVSVRNVSSKPLHYFMVERHTQALVNWARCTPEGGGCPTIAPGEPIRIPYSQVVGYEAGDREAILHWWTSERQADGTYRVGRTGAAGVRL